MITLYRIVSDAEAQDLQTHGLFRLLDGGMEVKEFWETVAGYLHFLRRARLAQLLPPYMKLVVVSLDIPAISWSHEIMELDCRPALVFDADGLAQLNAHCHWKMVDL